MKLFTPLLLAFAFAGALAGCVNGPVPSPVSPSAPTVTAAISEAGNQQVFLPNGALPKESYEPLAQPVRFYEDVTKTFIPSKEYGHIWPYVGAFLSAMMGRTQFFGLCDDKGRIICDPVFHKVDVLEKDGAKLYEFAKYTKDAQRRYRKLAKITLARPDGSWALECDELYTVSDQEEYSLVDPKDESKKWIVWRKESTLEYITFRKGDKWGAIDYKGNEILPCTYSTPLCFSEGLASVISDDGKSVYFIDSKGKTVLGPYGIPPKYDEANTMNLPLNYGLLFSEGLAHFYKDGKFGVIDKSGKVVVDAKYDYVSAYSGGTAKFLLGGKWGVLDSSGKVLMEPTDLTFFNSGNMTVQFYGRETYKTSYFDLITRTEKAKPDIPAQKYTLSSGVMTLKTKNGDKIFTGVRSCIELKSGNLAIGLKGDSWSWIIINSEGDTVYGPFQGQLSYQNKAGAQLFVYFGYSEDNAPDYFLRMTVYDETGKRLLPDTYNLIQPFDGNYIVRTDTAMGLMEEGGNWVIKVPLYEFMGD